MSTVMNTPSGAARSAAEGQASAEIDRLAGLSPTTRGLVEQATREIAAEQLERASETLRAALTLAPTHPEALRLFGVANYRQNRHDIAIAALRQAQVRRPDDALILNDLGNALAGTPDTEAALASWRAACRIAPDFGLAWYNLGRQLREYGDVAGAAAALQKAVDLLPDHWQSRAVLGDALVELGRVDEGAALFRAILAERPQTGRAWWDLANIKTVPLRDDEVEVLGAQLASADLPDADRIGMGFALAKALEDRARYTEAFAYFSDANARMSRRAAWNAAGFPQLLSRIVSAFSAARTQAPTSDLGHEVIFVVSMPRSGSTLVEQILAAHADVEGGSELPYLGQVITEESQRRRMAFPDWVSTATAADWERMGRRYLALAARWLQNRPRLTDKMPTNWMLIGAIRAMLPGAHIVHSRRDAVETCWSCFKQLFTRGQEYTYDLGHLAVYRQTYERAMRSWSELFPNAVHELGYEALLDEPERQTRALLDFCALPFDPACLRPHEAERSIRTPSSAQVRQPLRRDTARAVHYGKLLDPLRNALRGNA
ncbi:MAG TPA: sulfotransferase [Dokdonella sp.]